MAFGMLEPAVESDATSDDLIVEPANDSLAESELLQASPQPQAEDLFHRGTIIKVIGVGGGGGNAVEHMIRTGVQGVEFICANTDAQALSRSSASLKVQLGSTGLGAGSKPEVGAKAATSAREAIRAAIEGAHMLFITAGMGGGTGTGAAPVIAELAREMGILTVGVVTKPFEFEGFKRCDNAEKGAQELETLVDSLIVVLNDKLFMVFGEDMTQKQAFCHANDVLLGAVGGISEIINKPGIINADFEDVRTVMSEPGTAMMGSAEAEGPDRAHTAAEKAIACPLLEGDGMSLADAKGVLVYITASDTLKLSETKTVMSMIKSKADQTANVIMGSVEDNNMGDRLRVTVIATGLKSRNQRGRMDMHVIRTGTDAEPIWSSSTPASVDNAAGQGDAATTDAGQSGDAPSRAAAGGNGNMQSDDYDIPSLMRKRRDVNVDIPAFHPNRATPVNKLAYDNDTEVPAFLRRSAD